MGKKRVTIVDVAEYCHVSTATVSRVINGTGGFNEETERAVNDAVKKLGYVPNLNAKSLRTSNNHMVGILVSDMTYEYVNRIVSTLGKKLFEEGYITIVCDVGKSFENEQAYLDTMMALDICALFVLFSDRSVKEANQRKIPVVYMGRSPSDLSDELCCAIETDDVNAGFKAGSALIEAGCRDIAMVRVKRSEQESPRGREIGFLRALWEHNYPCKPELSVAVPESGYGAAFDSMNEKLRTGQAADGYFCESDVCALGVIKSLEINGYSIPGQVKVIGCNDMPAALYNNKELTTIRHDIDRMCEQAVSNMKTLLEGGKLEQKKKIFDVELIKRKTT